MCGIAKTCELQRVEVVANALIADGVKELLLVPIDDKPVDWTAGSHIVVHLPSGKTRQYSLTGDPLIKDYYRIAIKLEKGGEGGSQEMHDLPVGSAVEISRPINNFSLIDSSEPHLLIAGGIGITPLLSMAYDLARAGRPWRMIVCNRFPGSTPFLDELSSFPPQRIDLVYTEEKPERRLSFDALFASIDPKTRVYLCGSGRFNHSAALAYRASGHRPDDLIYESFSAAQQSFLPVEEGFFVELAISGHKFWVPKDKSILDVVEAGGVRVDSVCRQGYCGTCVVPVLAGAPIYRDDNLFTDSERASAKIMTLCKCRANGDIKISL